MVAGSERSEVSVRSGAVGILVVVVATAALALTAWLLALGIAALVA